MQIHRNKITLPDTPQHYIRGFAAGYSLSARTCKTNSTLILSYCVIPSLKRLEAVQEFQPVVHHLRLSASA